MTGNITRTQISNVTITTNPSSTSTTVAFTITGENGTNGFSNVTLPKTAILKGTIPVLFVDGQQSPSQNYTQDSNNFYVWFTTHFSAHQITIRFTMPITPQVSSFSPLLVVGLTVPEIVLIYVTIAIRRLKRRPEDY
jgi:hypothetical protein